MDTTPLRADARASRERILAAAHEVLRERGIEAEVKEIAERAGVGVGTLYRHFPTKDDLIAGIAVEMFGVVQQIIGDALAIDDPIGSLRALLRGGLESVDRYGDLIEVLHSTALPAIKQRLDFDMLLAQVAGIVQKGIDRGVYRADLDAELAATVLLSSLHPEPLQMLRRSRTLQQIVDGGLALFLNGALRQPGVAR